MPRHVVPTILLTLALLSGALFLAPATEPAALDGTGTDGGGDDARTSSSTLPSSGGLSLSAALPNSDRSLEPTLEITADGRMFVTAIVGLPSRSAIWEYLPAHDQWVRRGINLERTGEMGGGDADLEIDALGRFYHVDLSLANNGIAVSEDGINWIGSPVSHYVPVVDRQWLAHKGAESLYMVTNQIPGGAVLFKADIGGPLGHLGGLFFEQELPVGCMCGPPGFPSVHQATGALYMPFFGPSDVRVYRNANDGGLGFHLGIVPGTANIGQDIFPISAVDAAGNVYVVWSGAANGENAVWFSASTNGVKWSHPVKVTSGGTHVMPWIVAGDDGRVGIFWYGTTAAGNPNTLPAGTPWRVMYAESLNAASASPTFTTWDATGVIHEGTISTGGLQINGGADRSLGDFLSAALDPTTGIAYVTYVRNDAAAPAGERGVHVAAMPPAATPLLAAP